MIYGIYSMRDVKTGFLPCNVDVNDESAIRNFEFAFKHNDSLFATFPSDYSLYKLGEYDTDSGEINACYPPTWLADAPRKDNKDE